MAQFSSSVFQLGFLVLLCALVLSAIAVLRADMYGVHTLFRLRDRTGPAQQSAQQAPARTELLSRPAWELRITEGPLRGTTVPLASAPVTIGRAPTSTVVIDDDYCSARHARIFLAGGSWHLEDLGSTNGTVLNGSALREPALLEVGSTMAIGETRIEVDEQ